MGDATCQQWDLLSGSRTQTFTGHCEYLHCVKLKPESSQLFTGSEDGSVRVWVSRLDVRNATTCRILDHEKACEVSDYSGKHSNGWISTMDINDDWLACGGNGIHMWYLPDLQYCSYIPIPSVQSLIYYKNEILSGGIGTAQESNLYSWAQDGRPLMQAKTSIPSIVTIAKYQSGQDCLIAASGVSDKIDMFPSSDFISLRYSFTLSM